MDQSAQFARQLEETLRQLRNALFGVLQLLSEGKSAAEQISAAEDLLWNARSEFDDSADVTSPEVREDAHSWNIRLDLAACLIGRFRRVQESSLHEDHETRADSLDGTLESLIALWIDDEPTENAMLEGPLQESQEHVESVDKNSVRKSTKRSRIGRNALIEDRPDDDPDSLTTAVNVLRTRLERLKGSGDFSADDLCEGLTEWDCAQTMRWLLRAGFEFRNGGTPQAALSSWFGFKVNVDQSLIRRRVEAALRELNGIRRTIPSESTDSFIQFYHHIRILFSGVSAAGIPESWPHGPLKFLIDLPDGRDGRLRNDADELLAHRLWCFDSDLSYIAAAIDRAVRFLANRNLDGRRPDCVTPISMITAWNAVSAAKTTGNWRPVFVAIREWADEFSLDMVKAARAAGELPPRWEGPEPNHPFPLRPLRTPADLLEFLQGARAQFFPAHPSVNASDALEIIRHLLANAQRAISDWHADRRTQSLPDLPDPPTDLKTAEVQLERLIRWVLANAEMLRSHDDNTSEIRSEDVAHAEQPGSLITASGQIVSWLKQRYEQGNLRFTMTNLESKLSELGHPQRLSFGVIRHLLNARVIQEIPFPTHPSIVPGHTINVLTGKLLRAGASPGVICYESLPSIFDLPTNSARPDAAIAREIQNRDSSTPSDVAAAFDELGDRFVAIDGDDESANHQMLVACGRGGQLVDIALKNQFIPGISQTVQFDRPEGASPDLIRERCLKWVAFCQFLFKAFPETVVADPNSGRALADGRWEIDPRDWRIRAQNYAAICRSAARRIRSTTASDASMSNLSVDGSAKNTGGHLASNNTPTSLDQTKQKQPKKTKGEWKLGPPTGDWFQSYFDAKLVLIAKIIDKDQQTLRRHNGNSWWIWRIDGKTFRLYGKTSSQFAAWNQQFLASKSTKADENRPKPT
ncbi:MAG: hypothetical protein SFV23_01295 [Planctomycetaceae bacterium]|nr:hypothetical protein [Planctomycetaceae bacterium]